MTPQDRREIIAGMVILLVFLAIVIVASIVCPPVKGEYLDVPKAFRQENYNRPIGPLGIARSSYSCVHASNTTMLRWSNMERKAEWWLDTYYGGENLEGLISKLEGSRLRFDYNWGDTEWLEWAIRNRLVVGLGGSPYSRHALNLVGLTDTKAIFINNLSNGTRLESMNKEEFYVHWRENGWAWCLVYMPPPAFPSNPEILMEVQQ